MIITILIFLLILSILVLAHELGHFWTAKKAGVAVEEFGFGFPPRLFKFKKNATIYSINLIPIGGFVKIKGESGEAKDQPNSFANKPYWQKTMILASGVTMNIILAFIIISIGFMIGLPTVINEQDKLPNNIREQKIQISYIYPQSPAELAGLKVGDTIITIDNQNFVKATDLEKYIREHQNSSLTLEVGRGNEKNLKEITPQLLENQGPEKYLGVNLITTGIISYNIFFAIYHGFITTFSVLWQIITALFFLLKNLFSGQSITEQISGPIGVAVLTSQVSKMGWIYIMQFTALLSLNLAVINIFPFPALDGGRILFIIIEKIRGKPNNERIESIVHNIGFSLLMLLIVFVTYKDLVKYGQQILTNIKSVF